MKPGEASLVIPTRPSTTTTFGPPRPAWWWRRLPPEPGRRRTMAAWKERWHRSRAQPCGRAPRHRHRCGGTRQKGGIAKRLVGDTRRLRAAGRAVPDEAATVADLAPTGHVAAFGGFQPGFGGGSGFHWSFRQGWRPSMARTRRSWGVAAHLQEHRRICRHGGGGRVLCCRCSLAAQRESF